MIRSIGIIGFGNMGESMAAGLSREFPGIAIGIVEKAEDRRTHAVSAYGVKDFSDNPGAMFEFTDLAVIAVKPLDLDATLETIAPFVTSRTRFISVVAGKTIDSIRARLPEAGIARFMPNIAALVGRAFVGIAFEGKPDPEFRDLCFAVASAFGTPGEFSEHLMAAVTGLSGSGIAYVFSFLHALALGGTKAGICYDRSLEISLSILEGAAAVVRETGEHPAALLSKVASPAGTTIEGITELEDRGFTAAVIRAVEAASRRARESES